MIKNKEWPGGTNVKSASYDTVTQELTVNFVGGTYVYSDVEEDVWSAIEDAPSGGKIINQIVKNNYEYKKL